MTQPLAINNLSAQYGPSRILDDFSLEVNSGELVSLLGASGCGKTTTLRVVAGFLQPSAGTIALGENDLTKLPAHKRDIGIVFQNFALFPHLNVLDNVMFGLKQRDIAAGTRDKRALEMLDRVGLSAFHERLPAVLSGGQKQRVALARALVIEPSLLMFDEPLSNLDATLRVDMRVEIRQLQRSHGTTAIYVTHDQEEAFSISDRVAIMDQGKIMQFDRPEVLYQKPGNAFVARFVGFENLIRLRVVARGADIVSAVADGGIEITLSQTDFGAIPDAFVLAARADGLAISSSPASGGIPATAGLRTYLGRAYQYQWHTAVGPLVANGSLAEPYAAGSTAHLMPVPEQCCILRPE